MTIVLIILGGYLLSVFSFYLGGRIFRDDPNDTSDYMNYVRVLRQPRTALVWPYVAALLVFR